MNDNPGLKGAAQMARESTASTANVRIRPDDATVPTADLVGMPHEPGFTPGPWMLHKQLADLVCGDCDWSLQTEEAGAFLLFCHHPSAPAEANARLIAASPALFYAARRALAYVNRDEDADDMAEVAEALSTAIAEATGGQSDV
jgi:hypothetical protein